jgi:YfiH family protein
MTLGGWGDPPRPLRLAFTGRWGGVSRPPFHTLNLGFKGGDDPAHVRENRRRVAEALGVPLGSWVLLRQVHSCEVVEVAGSDAGAGSLDYLSGLAEADAMITRSRRVALCVLTADCLPVALAGGSPPVMALAHSGWKGTLGGIAGRTVRTMGDRYGTPPRGLRAWIGPGIGSCCYRVGAERAHAFAERFDPPGVQPGEDGSVVAVRDGSYHLDLKGAVRRDLVEKGIPEEHITESGICTCCDRDYFSHRRDGETGRQAVLMWMAG